MRKLVYVSCLLLLMAGPIYSQNEVQDEQSLTLKAAVNYALRNNESIQKARLDEESAEYKIKETKGSGLPQLNAFGQLNHYPALATQLLPGELAGEPGTMIPVQFGTKYSATGGLELQQLIFNKSFFVGLEAASTTRDLYRLRSEMTEEQVIYNVSAAYLQLLQTKEQFSTVDANYKRLEQLEEILKLQYENDVVTKVQVNRVIVSKTNLENQRKSLMAIYEQQLNGLKFFMNMPMGQEIVLDESSDLQDVLVPTADGMEEVLEARAEYKVLQTQKHLYNLNVKNVTAGYYPSLSAFAQANTNAQRNEFDFLDGDKPWFKAVSVGLQLNIPIFDGFQRRNRIKQARIEVEKVDQDLNQLRQNTSMELTNARTQMQTSLSSIETQERNVALAQEVYDDTNEVYKEGLAPLTDLLDVEVSLREAETNLNRERLNYQLSKLDYLRAQGNLEILTQ